MNYVSYISLRSIPISNAVAAISNLTLLWGCVPSNEIASLSLSFKFSVPFFHGFFNGLLILKHIAHSIVIRILM